MTANKYLTENFVLWQEYAQAYGDFVIEATQKTLAQSLTFRERMDAVIAESVEKTQALNVQEQAIALGAVEALQAQAKSVSERVSKMFETASAS